jgi:hypothetical protein
MSSHIRAVCVVGFLVLGVWGASRYVALAASSAPDGRAVVLTELFTSEGCSSCPSADEVLSQLVHNQPIAGVEVLALGEHVDYWDRLGWRDRFSSALYSNRQSNYDARVFHRNEVYTPQLVIDGWLQRVGSDVDGMPHTPTQRSGPQSGVHRHAVAARAVVGDEHADRPGTRLEVEERARRRVPEGTRQSPHHRRWLRQECRCGRNPINANPDEQHERLNDEKVTDSNAAANVLLVYDTSGSLIQAVSTQGQGGVSGNAGGDRDAPGSRRGPAVIDLRSVAVRSALNGRTACRH